MEAELRQIREGTHVTLRTEQRKLEDVRNRQKAEVNEFREMRIRLANEEFEREKRAAEQDYKTEEEALRERFLNEFDERRRRTDEGRFDGNFSQMRAAAIRKMRTRSNVEATSGGAQQQPGSKRREKLSWGAIAFGLKPNEVNDDLDELNRAYVTVSRADEQAAAEEPPPKRPRAPDAAKANVARKVGARAKLPDMDLKGKAVHEVTGQRITVWYEEQTSRGKQDVPYVGSVINLKKDGVTVHFDGSEAGEEELITNEDEWLWGEHKKKPSQVPPR